MAAFEAAMMVKSFPVIPSSTSLMATGQRMVASKAHAELT